MPLNDSPIQPLENAQIELDTLESKKDTHIERVGVILVHGIGEQRRFEHLNGQGREIILAIKAQHGIDSTVDIGAHTATQYYADQDTWSAGEQGPVNVFVSRDGRVTHQIDFHEVWWADINERYSVAKQFRFWLWGLAVWAYPRGSKGQPLRGTVAVVSPQVPGLSSAREQLKQRIILFLVGAFFFLSTFPLGLGLWLVERVLNLKTPDYLKLITNYVSGVKLFNQRTRHGLGFGFHPPNDDFLDNLDQPPRVSVRRRMIRAIATVAKQDYDRWYIVAHSQGTVVAFNGLMETPFAWPGYFDKAAWSDLMKAGLCGSCNIQAGSMPTMPKRPVWGGSTDIAYRSRIFSKFQGILTLGSPLEKFAAIWPARVPISLIAAFRTNTEWINVFDPIDPVSGVLRAYQATSTTACPIPKNIGYPASWLLLYAHLCYLKWTGPNCLADGVAKWLLTGDPTAILTNPKRFSPGRTQFRLRYLVAITSTILVVFFVAATAGAAALAASIYFHGSIGL